MAVLLAFLAAVSYGSSDFIAGLVSRRIGPLLVLVIGQAAGLVLLLVILPVFGGAPAVRPMAWGVLAGAGATVGTLALYRGLGTGRMNVVAPLSGVGAAALPVLAGVALGERLGARSVAGVVLAIAAIVAVCSGARGRRTDRVTERLGVREGLAAGAGFALLFVALQRAGTDNGLWPLLAAQVSALAALASFGLATGRRLRPVRAELPATVAAGLLGVTAVLLFVLATGHGLLSIVAVVTALYPAVTVLLAVAVLREPVARIQFAGLVAAAVGVALIVSGADRPAG
ncbi:MAG TPA: DMT family transporter [Mycobacteriales bacterium]|nr:DMT family transporter [Mycobacteriales bacterium]